jgi:hypothetical protein
MGSVRFSYYERLSRSDKAIYRKSDALTDLRVPAPGELREAIEAIRAGLAADERAAVQRASRALVGGLTGQLEVEPVDVRVLARRPSNATGELHGLYESEEGEVAVIRVWMRTAAQKKPVRFRTFVRTLLHEVCHHLDYSLYGLADSFHTEGFFKRESAMARQLLPPAERRAPKPSPADRPKREAVKRRQLDLFSER